MILPEVVSVSNDGVCGSEADTVRLRFPCGSIGLPSPSNMRIF